MLRSPNHESRKRESEKASIQAKSGENIRTGSGGGANGQCRRNLSPRKYFPTINVSVEKSLQRSCDSWIQGNEGRSSGSEGDDGEFRNSKSERGTYGSKRSACSYDAGVVVAEKKRSLGLEGDLRGRHLSAKDRVGLLEIIKIAQAEGVTCERSCKLLELNPRTVYRWRNDRISDCHGGGGGQNKITEAEEKTVVEWARAHPDQRCRRIAYELERAEKAFIGKTKVAAILKKHGINHPFEKGKGRPDIPPQDMLLHEPWKVNLLWGMDWTWVRVNGKFMFLLVLLDWYSRKILAWGLFWQITRIEVVAIVTDAVAKEDIENLPEKTLRPIVVADHGSANSCNHTRTNIEFLGLDLWLSGVGRPTGNARTERVIGTLKREEILLQDEYKNETQAQEKIGHSIFDYNNLRPNAGNGGFAPSIVHQHGRRIPTEKRLMNRQKTETERRNHSKTNQGSLPS